MVLIITILAFVLSFLGILIANIIAKKSNEVRKDLTFLNDKKKESNDIVNNFNVSEYQLNLLEEELANVKKRLFILENKKQDISEASSFENIKGFKNWHDAQRKLVGRSGSQLSIKISEYQNS